MAHHPIARSWRCFVDVFFLYRTRFIYGFHEFRDFDMLCTNLQRAFTIHLRRNRDWLGFFLPSWIKALIFGAMG